VNFPIPHRAACHGLAGYFECVLYSSTPVPTMSSASSTYTPEEDYRSASAVVLSTNPNSMPQLSPDMMSWFPLYFPLKRAVWFPDDSECVINIWRKEDGRKVWYEWIVEAFISVDAGRGRGKKRVKVGGSEVHSSAEEGCLM
jgi:type II protein arginine methyltransferase